MRVLPLVGILALTACAGGPDRSAVLNGLVGQDEAVVVGTLGVPSRVLETGGHRFLAYDEEHSSQIVGGAGFFGAAGSPYGSGFGLGFAAIPAEIVRYGCETTLDVVGGRLVKWVRRGNACL